MNEQMGTICDRKIALSNEVEGWQQPAKISLGLLPSGPDPVGEHNACANLPGAIWWFWLRKARDGKSSG